MYISLTNTIGALARKLGIVKKNLQLWLDFEKSEVVGGEEVVNGGFDTDILSWVDVNSSAPLWNSSLKCLEITAPIYNGAVRQILTLNSGSVYEVSYSIVGDTQGSGGNARVGVWETNSDASLISDSFYTRGLTESYSFRFTAKGTNQIRLYKGSNSGITQFDNISVKEVTQFVKDKSPNTNNAKLFTGKAMSFDGVNDYVDCGNSSDITSPNKLSFLGWVINEDVTQNDTVFIGNIVAGGWQIGVKSNGSIYFRVRADNDVTIVSSTNFGDATPHRVVATYDRTTMKLYVDGSLEATSSNTGDIDTPTQNTYIGADAQGASGQGDFFNGVLSDFQVWNEDVEQSDVTFDYNNPNHLVIDNPNTTIALSNLKGYWALSEGDGLVAYDSSGEGNNGTIIGATYIDKQPTIPQLGMMDWAKSTPVVDEITLIQDPNNKGFDILGNVLRLREHGFNLDGSGYGEVADDDSLDFGTGDITMSCWLKYDFLNTGSSYNVALGLGGNYVSSANIATRNDDKLYFLVNNIEIKSNSIQTNNAWVNVVGVRESGVISMYVDSVLQTQTLTSSATITNSLTKYVGRDSTDNRHYQNLIDEPLIYNRALTLKEIQQNYKIGLKEHKVGSAFSDDFSSDFGF